MLEPTRLFMQGQAGGGSKPATPDSAPTETHPGGLVSEPEPTHSLVATPTLVGDPEGVFLGQNLRSYASSGPVGSEETPRPVCKIEIEPGRVDQWGPGVRMVVKWN